VSDARTGGAAFDDDPNRRHLAAGWKLGCRLRRRGLRFDEINPRRCLAYHRGASKITEAAEVVDKAKGYRSPELSKASMTERDKAARESVENEDSISAS
jgi:hypothetical protein